MSINVQMKDANTVVINDAIKVTDGVNGLEVELLTTPNSAWVDSRGRRRVPNGAGMMFADSRRSMATMERHEPTQVASPDSDAIDRDPHYYRNGNNGLTIAESARRVVEKLYYGTWGDFTIVETGTPNDINKVVRHIIRNNKGRDYAYTLGGRVKNLKQSKGFERYTCAKLLEWAALMDGALDTPVLG